MVLPWNFNEQRTTDCRSGVSPPQLRIQNRWGERLGDQIGVAKTIYHEERMEFRSSWAAQL